MAAQPMQGPHSCVVESHDMRPGMCKVEQLAHVRAPEFHWTFESQQARGTRGIRARMQSKAEQSCSPRHVTHASQKCLLQKGWKSYSVGSVLAIWLACAAAPPVHRIDLEEVAG